MKNNSNYNNYNWRFHEPYLVYMVLNTVSTLRQMEEYIFIYTTFC